MSDLILILITLLGTILGSLLSVLPALHIYNVVGLLLLVYLKFFFTVPVIYVVVFMLGMLVSYSFLNTIPSVYLGAPDESTVFMLLPGLKYMFLGRGWESVILTGV
jgi:putative membrane protein